MRLDQQETPYFDALENYVTTNVLGFHVPGHQQGRGVPRRFRDFISQYAMEADITQVLGMDDIHRPLSVCKKAQELTADAYGVDYSYFLINGSSSGNQVMLMATLGPGDKVFIPRNAHRSTMAAMIMCGARAIFYEPVYDEDLRVDHTAILSNVEDLIQQHPDAKALYFTSPTYYGVTTDTKAMVDLAHRYNLLALADEAWGAHLHFHPELPSSAVEAGADLVVHSTHKMISGMTQASWLHLQGTRVDRARLEMSIRMFLSTSPSCLLLASLDMTRYSMVHEGEKLIGEAIRLSDYARQQLSEIEGLSFFDRSILEREGVYGWDPTRLVVNATKLGYTGYEIEKRLRYDHNIQIEMSEFFNTVSLITLGHTEEHIDRLVLAYKEILSQPSSYDVTSALLHYRQDKGRKFDLPDFPEQAMTLSQAFYAPYETVSLKDSVGRICAEMVTPYPPGIPLICPGEVITAGLIEYMTLELSAGVSIQGVFDSSLETIRVVKD